MQITFSAINNGILNDTMTIASSMWVGHQPQELCFKESNNPDWIFVQFRYIIYWCLRSKILFEDQDNNITQIQASHDGTNDDYKGDLIFQVRFFIDWGIPC